MTDPGRTDPGRPEPRLYGHWRPERGWGVGDLGAGRTVTVFVAVLAPLLVASFAPRAALALGLFATLVVSGVTVRIGGSTAAEALTRRLRFASGRAKGWTELSGGLITEHPRRYDLPGPLAPLVALDTDDGRGGRQALVFDRHTGTLSTVLRCAPAGLDLARRASADEWVACWGAWLADLGHRPVIRHVAVTVDSGGSAPADMDYVRSRISPDAPPVARQLMHELVELTPATSAHTDTRVTITLDPARAAPRPTDLLGSVAEVTRWLPGLEAGLTSCGVGVLGRETVSGLTARIRSAFDPVSRDEIARQGEAHQLRSWAHAGPVAATETWDAYRHDSGISVSWALLEAPRQAVSARVLVPLLAPGPYSRRVSLLYLPYPADQAAARVESEITAGQMRKAWAQRTRRDETQRERDDRDRAMQAAREEAEGAGVGRLTVYVSTTVTDPGQLPAAIADVEQRAGAAKLRLRRMWGAQQTGFAASLGLGLNPNELAARGRGR
ncbi:MAG: SCO6880 family protein [Pseudonocardia sp.]